ncbi:MAG: proprotein convertase P-domain-containing protein [Flavobacteriaceae bacterium]
MKKITLLWQLAILVFFGFQLNAQRFYSSGERGEVQVTTQTKLEIEIAKRSFTSRSSANTSPQMMASTYVGSFAVSDGPAWPTNPPCYTGQEAAALIFGGSPSDYYISTNPNTVDPSTITHTAWASTWGTGCSEVAEDYKLDIGNPGYNDPGGTGTATSAYVTDWCTGGQTNYVWLAGPAPITECGNAPENIPNGAPGVSSGLMNPSVANVAIAGNIGVDYTIDNISLNLQHTWADDLEIVIVSPAGTRLALCTDNGGSTGLDTVGDLVFTDASANNVTAWDNTAPAADYRAEGGTNTYPVATGNGPGEDMNVVFNGESITGNWTLEINDDAGGDVGVLNSYCITFAPVLGSPPIISCPMDIFADTDPGQCGAVVNYAAAVAIDPDGDLDTIEQVSPDPNVLGSGDEFPTGTTVVTFRATDLAGNFSECSFNITVTDNEAPVVTCADQTVELDATGNVTVFPGDVATATDNCPGVTMSFLLAGVPGPTDSITTLFNRNNGGSFGGAVYFDVTVGPADIIVTDLETNTQETGAMTMDVYTLVGTYVGNQQNPAPWTLMATGSGTGAGLNNPSMLALDNDIILTANTTYGFALVMDASHGHDYSGLGTNPAPGSTSYSNADLSLSLGSANNTPFSSAPFSPRIWNGSLIYQTYTTVPVPSLDFTCADVGDNTVTVEAMDAEGNTSTCTAVITVEDNTAPVIACIGEPVDVTDTASDSPGVAIPDNDTNGVSTTLTVTDDFIITDLNVDLDISHTWVGDIDVTLESPSGTTVTILTVPGYLPHWLLGQRYPCHPRRRGWLPRGGRVRCACPPSTVRSPRTTRFAFDGESTLGTDTYR